MTKITVKQMVWVYGSTLMPPEWRAWACIGLSETELAEKCKRLYGRVPYDCVAKMVPLSDVPKEFFTLDLCVRNEIPLLEQEEILKTGFSN